MAKGGKQPGAGRPKGSTTRPQIRDYFTHEEIVALVEDAKEKAKTDPSLQKFLLEQIFGKAVQPIGGDKENPLIIKGVEITVRK